MTHIYQTCLLQGWGLSKGEKIEGLNTLRTYDQEMVENQVNNISAVSIKKGKGKAGAKATVGVLDGFEIGYAPSSRAKCRKTDCKVVIFPPLIFADFSTAKSVIQRTKFFS